MKKEERINYVKYRVEKANETLDVVDLLIENKKWNSTINRLYYATYYMISALLIKDEIISKSHSGLKAQFYLNYVRDKQIPSDVAKIYSDLFDWRQKGDYGDFFDFTEEDMLSILQPTKDLISSVEKIITQNYQCK